MRDREMPNVNFSIISSKSIRIFVEENYQEIFDLIKSIYVFHEEGKTTNPNSYFLRFPHRPSARIIALPAAINEGDQISGIKWISSYPTNYALHMPRASAVIILNDYNTGYPIACLEGSVISAVRTVCSAILAAEYLNNGRKTANKVCFIGNGLIAQHVYNCLDKRGWRINEISLFDINYSASQAFKTFLQKDYDGEIRIAPLDQRFFEGSDLIIFTTTAQQPYLDDIAYFEHAPIILHISLRDLSPAIMFAAENITDDIEHVLSASTSLDLAAREYQNRDFIKGTIGSLMGGKISLDNTKPRIFSPMGMGILDIALANLIYQSIDDSEKLTIADFHP